MLLKRCVSFVLSAALCLSGAGPILPAYGAEKAADESAAGKGSYTDAPQPGQIHIYAGSAADIVDDWGDKLESLIPQEQYLNQAKSQGSLARMLNNGSYGRSKEMMDFAISAQGVGYHRKSTQRVAYKDASFTYDIPIDANTPAPLYLSMEIMGEVKVAVNDTVKLDTGAVGWYKAEIVAHEIVLTDPADWAGGMVSVTFYDADPSTGSANPNDAEFGMGAHLLWLELGASSAFRDRVKHILWDTKDVVWNLGYLDGRSTEFQGSETRIENALLADPGEIHPDASVPYEIQWSQSKNSGSEYYLLVGVINGEKSELVVEFNNTGTLRAPSSEEKGLGANTERVHDFDVTDLVRDGANSLSLTLPQGGSLDFAALVEVAEGTVAKDQLKMSFGGSAHAQDWTKLINSTMYFHNDMMTDKSTGYIVASLPNGLFPQLYFLADSGPAMLEMAKWGYVNEAKQATLFRTAKNHNGADNGAAGIVYATIAYLMKGDNYQGDYIQRAWPLLKEGLDGLNDAIDPDLKLIKGNNVETTNKEYGIYNNSIDIFAFLAGAEAAENLGMNSDCTAWKAAAATLAEGIGQNLITAEDTKMGSNTIGRDTWKYGITDSKSVFNSVNAGWFGVGSQEELYYGYKGYSANPDTGDQETRLLNEWRDISNNTLQYHSENFWKHWAVYGHNRGFGTSYGALSERGGWPVTTMLMSDEIAMFTKNLNHIIWNSSDLHFEHGNMGVQETSPWLLIREADKFDHGIADPSEIGNGGDNEDMNAVEYIVTLRNARIMAGLDDTLEGGGNINIIPRLPLGFDSVSVNGWTVNYKDADKTGRTQLFYDYKLSNEEASLSISAANKVEGSRFRFGPFDLRAELESATVNGSDVTASAVMETRGDSKWVWVDGDINTSAADIVVKVAVAGLSVSGETANATQLFERANTSSFDLFTDVQVTSGQAGLVLLADAAHPQAGYRYLLDTQAGEEGQLRLEKMDGAVLRTIDLNVNKGRSYRLRVVGKDSTLIGFLDGVEVMRVIDGSTAQGIQGVHVNGNAVHKNITCINNADTITISPLASAAIQYHGGYEHKEVPHMLVGQSKKFSVIATFESGETLDVTGTNSVAYQFTNPDVLEVGTDGMLTAKALGKTAVQAEVTIGNKTVQTNTTPEITVEEIGALYVYTPKPNEGKRLDTVPDKTKSLTLWTKYSNGERWILDDEMPELDLSFAVEPAGVATVQYDFSRDSKDRTQITATAPGEASVQASVTINGKTVTSPAGGEYEDFKVVVHNPDTYPNFIENFEDGTAERWNGSATYWSVVDGRYKVTDTTGNIWSISDAQGVNFAYSADVELESGIAAGLTFRSSSGGGSSYDLIMDVNEGLKLNIRPYFNLAKVPMKFDYNVPYRLKVVVKDNTLQAYVNGELKLSYDKLDEYDIGNYGLISFVSSAYFGNIKAYVQNQLEYITLGDPAKSKFQMENGSTTTLPIRVRNADETEGNHDSLVFISSNPAVATMDSTGQITTHGIGQTEITAQVDIGSEVISSNVLTVMVYSAEGDEHLSSISLSSGGIDTIAKGQQVQINLEALLSDGVTACNPEETLVDWSISPKGIAVIKASSNSGITLLAKNPGELSVTATVAYRGQSKTTDIFKIKVEEGEGFHLDFAEDSYAGDFTQQGSKVWRVEDGVMKMSGGGGDYWNVYKEVGADFEFSADVTLFSGNSAGISFRKNGVSDGGYDLIFSFFDGLKLSKRPEYKELKKRSDLIPKEGQTYKLTVIADGNEITAYLDGKEVIKLQDDSFASGNFALFGFGDTVAHFNHIDVKPLDKAPPIWGAAALTVSGLAEESLTLHWDAATDASGIAEYLIYQDGVQIGNAAASQTSYTVNGLAKATQYTFKVEAVDTRGNTSADGPEISVTTLGDIRVTGVTLDQAALIMEIGEITKLTATVTPDDAANKSVIWTSDNTDVAAVDTQGNVTAIGEGEAHITVTTEDGGFTDSITVVVEASGGIIPVQKVKINASGLFTLSIKKKAHITATVEPSNATDQTLKWISTNTNIFTVDEDGNITPKKQGTATLTAQSSNGLKSTIIVRITA